MMQLIEFTSNHYFLIGAFAGVAALLLWNLLNPSFQGYQPVEASEAVRLINHEDAVVIDVRESNEYQQGHVMDALHIPVGSLNNQLKVLEKYRESPLILMCHSGHRSANACSILKKNGFEKLYNLSGGITAWQNANLPLTVHKKRKA